MSRVSFLFFLGLCYSCNNAPPSNHTPETAKTKPDTIVYKMLSGQDLTEGAPIYKSYRYFVVSGADSSDFRCSMEWVKDGYGIRMGISFCKDMYYRAQYDQLKKILAEAQKDFDLDSLQSISIAYFEYSGDLAVRIGRKYEDRFGKERIGQLQLLGFMQQTALTEDFNLLFQPYGMRVKAVHCIECKLYPTAWMKKESLLSDTTSFPELFPHGIIFLEMEKL